jgi:response regulator RpfG family c-di-GMP phosphodiesterase
MAEYLLIVDDEEDLRDILLMSAELVYSGKILTAKSGNDAIRIMQENGLPLACVSDFRMPDGGGEVVFQYLSSQEKKVPFLICSGCDLDEIRQKIPSLKFSILKPNVHDDLVRFLEENLQKKKSNPDSVSDKYVAVRLSLLIRLGFVNSDLYLKLSENNFVKVFHPQSEFTPEDGLRFLKKNVVTLYILKTDASKFIHDIEKSIALFVGQKKMMSSEEVTAFSAETVEATRKLIKVFGFTSETIRLTQQSMELSLSAVMQQPDLKKLLETKLRDADGAFASHSSSTAFLACGLTGYLEWASDFTRNKLSLAAIMHDIFVNEDVYPYPQDLNEKAAKREGVTPDLMEYIDHPSKAAKLIAGRTEFPPDVDHIIAQHHERPDGTGFPSKLNSSRIHPLAALFIVCEDLVNFLGNREDFSAGVQEFLALRTDTYGHGNFRKVMQAVTLGLGTAK